jgi:hypothetical protein
MLALVVAVLVTAYYMFSGLNKVFSIIAEALTV